MCCIVRSSIGLVVAADVLLFSIGIIVIHIILFTVLFGYPPKEVPDYNPLLTLQSLGIKSGDTVTIEQLKSERQRMIEFRDVKKSQPNTSTISSSTPANMSQNLNLNSNSGQENDTEVILLDSRSADTSTKSAASSGTKRGLDDSSEAGGPSSSHKRYQGKLKRK